MKRKRLLLVLILITMFSVNSVLADGGFVIQDKDMWRMFDEGQQYCAINYKDGVQNMILTVDTAEELTGDRAVWIFPVPAKPDKVDINVIKGFPDFYGNDLEEEADHSLNEAYLLMSASQIYPFPFFFVFFGVMSPSHLSTGRRLLQGTKSDNGGVTVHERIEKMGLTTELVSASNSDAFTDYLVSQDLALPGDFKAILDEYIGQDYAFVVSWISDIAEFKRVQATDDNYYPGRRPGNTVGVFISFPTEKMYYPLKPTSVYEEQVVPAVIYVMNHVKPGLYDEIKKYTTVDYFFAYSYSPVELSDFFFGQKKITNLDYTKIKIEAPSRYLSQDLWIENEPPKKVIVYKSMVKNTFWWGLMIFILISCFSSLIAGMFLFKDDNPSPLKFFFFGLFNLLTLAGLWIAAYVKNIDYKFTQKEHSVFQRVNLSKGKKAAIIIPLIILTIYVLLIPISLVLELQDILFPLLYSFLMFFILLPLLIFLPLVLWGSYRHKNVLWFNLLFAGVFFILLIISRILLAVI